MPGKSHGQRNLASYSPWDCKRLEHDWACTQYNSHAESINDSGSSTSSFPFWKVKMEITPYLNIWENIQTNLSWVWSSVVIHYSFGHCRYFLKDISICFILFTLSNCIIPVRYLKGLTRLYRDLQWGIRCSGRKRTGVPSLRTPHACTVLRQLFMCISSVSPG